ncbi:MAG TPA: ribonuclease Z [candidate division Zixibacteria bacterium]|nr:ribonuclease Z [candidate division Zixibacteria bacterium]
MTTIRLIFLGTSGSVPQKDRFLSSIALQRDTGEILLFDCGEGAQYQIMKYNVNFQKIMKIFISHLHGDHIFGIFGLLNTMNLMERTAPLKIYGPPGTIFFFENTLGARSNFGFKYQIEFFENEGGFVCEEEDYQIISKRVAHSVYTLAYAFIEKDRLGRFNKEKAIALKVEKGLKWQQLQKGKSVLSEENKIVTPEMILGPKRKGFKIVIAYDGLYDEEEFVPFAMDADILVLESTFSDEHEEKALERLHSTARWSSKIARKANAKRLYLTHISPRHKGDNSLEKQAREEFPEAIIAYDGLEINLNRKDLNEEEN